MKKINIALINLIVFSLLGVTSCNFLDYDESVGYSDQDKVYETFSRAEQSLTNVYSYLDTDFGSIDGAMRDCATDDAQYVWSDCSVHIFIDGRWSPRKTIDTKWGLYDGIRAANQFILNMKKANYDKYKWNADYDGWKDKSQYWISEARVIRSLLLFKLAKRYGSIPLATDIYTTSNVNDLHKSSFDDVVKYIVSECDSAALILPVSYDGVTGAQTGRITKGAAIALKARTLLYAASPLFSDNNQEKWIKAAIAAKEVIDLGVYSIEDEDVVNNIQAKGLILSRRTSASTAFEKKNFPISFDKGNTGTCPSENLVEAFQTVNGYDVKLTSNGWSCDDPKFDPEYPYANRDKRFYKTVLYNGATFKNKVLECYEDGTEGLPLEGASKTGYYLKKYIMENVDLSPVEKPVTHNWVIFRYAEILLNYAEAMNEAYGADYTDDNFTMSALEAINKIRFRAGVPNISSGKSKDEFRTLVQRERRVEFAFENQRFWDLRRWKIGKQTENINGVDIVKAEDGTLSYSLKTLESRLWNDKYYLYPIPMSEIYKNTNLKPQNPLWN